VRVQTPRGAESNLKYVMPAKILLHPKYGGRASKRSDGEPMGLEPTAPIRRASLVAPYEKRQGPAGRRRGCSSEHQPPQAPGGGAPSPRYPANAFWPHGTLTGLQMGASALTDLKAPGFLRAIVSAPWPPWNHTGEEETARRIESARRAGITHEAAGPVRTGRGQEGISRQASARAGGGAAWAAPCCAP
jgi:hypothetical protein